MQAHRPHIRTGPVELARYRINTFTHNCVCASVATLEQHETGRSHIRRVREQARAAADPADGSLNEGVTGALAPATAAPTAAADVATVAAASGAAAATGGARKKRKKGGAPDPVNEFRRRIGLANRSGDCDEGLAAFREMTTAGLRADIKTYNSVRWDLGRRGSRGLLAASSAFSPNTCVMAGAVALRPRRHWAVGSSNGGPCGGRGCRLQAGRGHLHLPDSAVRRGQPGGEGLLAAAGDEGCGHQPEATDLFSAPQGLRVFG